MLRLIGHLLGMPQDLLNISMQAIGNLTTTSCGQETIAQVVSVDYVMDKLRELTNTPQSENFSKVNSAGQALLAAF